MEKSVNLLCYSIGSRRDFTPGTNGYGVCLYIYRDKNNYERAWWSKACFYVPFIDTPSIHPTMQSAFLNLLW